MNNNNEATITYVGKTKILSGTQSINQVQYEIEQVNLKKPLFVIGENTMTSKYIQAFLKRNNIKKNSIFFNFGANPNDISVKKCAAMYASSDFDSLVAIGGGSAMDVAKATSIIVSKSFNQSDMFSRKKVRLLDKQLLVCIPTTIGSGSEMSRNAVIYDTNQGRKRRILNDNICADIVILDPLVVFSTPKEVLRDSCIDALSHAIESYTSVTTTFQFQPLYKAVSAASIKTICNYFPLLNHSSTMDSDVIMRLQWAALLAGISLGSGSNGCHILAGILNEYCPSMTHGAAVAFVLPEILKINREKCYKQYLELYNIINDCDNVGISNYEKVSNFIQVIKNFVDTSSTKSINDYTDINYSILKTNIEVSTKDNPVFISNEEVFQIYKSILLANEK